MDFLFWKDNFNLYLYIEQKDLTPEASESPDNTPCQHLRLKNKNKKNFQ